MQYDENQNGLTRRQLLIGVSVLLLGLFAGDKCLHNTQSSKSGPALTMTYDSLSPQEIEEAALVIYAMNDPEQSGSLLDQIYMYDAATLINFRRHEEKYGIKVDTHYTIKWLYDINEKELDEELNKARSGPMFGESPDEFQERLQHIKHDIKSSEIGHDPVKGAVIRVDTRKQPENLDGKRAYFYGGDFTYKRATSLYILDYYRLEPINSETNK